MEVTATSMASDSGDAAESQGNPAVLPAHTVAPSLFPLLRRLWAASPESDAMLVAVTSIWIS